MARKAKKMTIKGRVGCRERPSTFIWFDGAAFLDQECRPGEKRQYADFFGG